MGRTMWSEQGLSAATSSGGGKPPVLQQDTLQLRATQLCDRKVLTQLQALPCKVVPERAFVLQSNWTRQGGGLDNVVSRARPSLTCHKHCLCT
jgi:hypothetical protein